MAIEPVERIDHVVALGSASGRVLERRGDGVLGERPAFDLVHYWREGAIPTVRCSRCLAFF
ncbi:hypothetical protein ACFW4X_13905 [Streptomyces smyrnaeus]|uniref:hypothetical protein n=1 Tax=Streptomyces smyrnaeus TaxID=1387713 RepID=UPI0036D11269